MSTVPRSWQYRRYLNSALHTRFLYAVLLSIVNGFGIAFLTGEDYFWSWFPVGPAGPMIAQFALCSIFVYFVQLATLTVGRRTDNSLSVFIRSLLTDLFKPSSTIGTYIITLSWYCASAFYFGELYILTSSERKNLGQVIKGDMSVPDRLNERPIYLRFFFLQLALVQSFIHVTYKHSALYIPVSKIPTTQSNDQSTHPIKPLWDDLKRALPVIGKHACINSTIVTISAPFIYRALFRNIFWQVGLFFAKALYDISSSDAQPPDTYFIGTIMGSAFYVGTILSFTWETSAYIFLRCLKQEPLKNGLPLSAASKDPNGTLLSGLKAKRPVSHTFAFWELAIIAQKFPDRRKAIFTDIERSEGPMWTSMHKAALDVICRIDQRLPSLEPKPAPTPVPQETVALPRLTKNIRTDKIAGAMPSPNSRSERVINFLAMDGAKPLGQSKDPWRPPIEQEAQKAIDVAKSELQRHRGVVDKVLEFSRLDVLQYFMGSSSSEDVAGKILGAPIGNAAVIVDAIDAVTKMLIASLNEDTYGKVVHTVPDTVKQFTRTILTIEKYVSSEEQSLTADDEDELREVLIIVDRLKSGLRELLSAFQIFLNDVGLGIKDLNEAKRASEERGLLPARPAATQKKSQVQPQSKGIEMEEVRNDTTSQRLESREKVPRIQQASRQQRRLGSSDGNVFGARDLALQSETGRSR